MKDFNLLLDRHNEQEKLIDIRLAKLCLVIAKSNGSKKSKINDFLPDYAKATQSAEDMLNVSRGIVASMGGEINGI